MLVHDVQGPLVLLLFDEQVNLQKGYLEDYLWIAERTDWLQIFEDVVRCVEVVPDIVST